MKHFKTGLLIVLALAFVTLFATVGTAYAQTRGPQNPGGRGPNGTGDCVGQCIMQDSDAAGTQTGLLHDEIISIIAEKLGISVDDLNARLSEGETLSEIANSLGWSYDDFRTLMTEARAQALTNLVEDGVISQDQADWLSERGSGQMMGRGRGGMMGQYANHECPYLPED